MTASPDPDDDERSMSETFKEANKDIEVFLEDGDINVQRSRSLLRCTGCLWKKSANGIVEVPYVVSAEYTDFENVMFDVAMKEFESMTCIKFVNRTTESDYISIQSGAQCWSYIGRIGGKQVVSIGMPACIQYKYIQHELLHALGFYHEHNRRDRDNYINVLWKNIGKHDQKYFELDNGNTLNLPYGYNSVMHLRSYEYSKISGQPSMVAKSDPNMPLGYHVGMDNLDVMKVNYAYKCNLCRRKFLDTGSFIYNSTSSDPDGSNCLYLIQTGNKVLLKLSDINVPSSPDCNDAYIKVYDGSSRSSRVLLNKTCTNVPIPPLISSGCYMLIEIVNNNISVESTFNATYEKVRYGGTFLKDNGVVTSHGFPNIIPRNADVINTIIAPEGYKVCLTFRYLWIHTSSGCTVEYLTIRDGASDTSPILNTYCGYYVPPPPPITSSGNIVVIHLHTRPEASNNGFYVEYDFMPTNSSASPLENLVSYPDEAHIWSWLKSVKHQDLADLRLKESLS
ncbi:astacin-like metalloendopeptidase [Leptodactylus fuscus]